MRKRLALVLAFSLVLTLLPKQILIAEESNDVPALGHTIFTDEVEVTSYEPEIEAEFPQIIVNVDDVLPEDVEKVTEVIGDYAILEYDSLAETEAAYEEYVESDIEEAYLPGLVEVTDTGEEGYKYIGWGSEAINADVFNDALIEKYGAVENIPEIKVAVIDTGVNYNADFLKGRVAKYDFNGVYTKADAMDDYDHGTGVAGTIVDSTLPNVKIYAYKVLNSHGQGSEAILAKGIMAAVEDGVDVINMSLRFIGNSPIIKEALDVARDADIVIVAAAGNDAALATTCLPAAYPDALTVSATNTWEEIASFSNFGPTIDIAAPGRNVKFLTKNGSYKTSSGTSISAPYVAGAAASLKAYLYGKDFSSKDLSTMLKLYAKDLGDPGIDKFYGYGLLSLSNLLASIDASAQSWPGVSANPVISLTELENGETRVEITSPEPDAKIYYTTNGEIPSAASGNLYTGAFTVNTALEIIAVAKTGAKYQSEIISERIESEGTYIESDFVITADGELQKYLGNETILHIPETIKGITVKSIADFFARDSDLEEIYIPDTVEELGGSMIFSSNVKKVSIGKNVKTISNSSFYGASLFNSLEVDSNNPYFVTEENVLYTKDYSILLSANAYNNGASYTVKQGCKKLGAGGFWGSSIEKIYMPASVEDFSYDTYGHWSVGDQSIAEFIADKDSPYYTSEDGVLFSKDKTILYGYDRDNTRSNYSIPDTVKLIGPGAFFAASKLKEVTIPEGVLTIRTSAFEGTGICNWDLPSTIESIEFIAFDQGKAIRVAFAGNAPFDCGNIAGGEPVEICHYRNATGFEEMIKDLSYYSEVTETILDGSTQIEFEIPEGYDGSLVYLDGIAYSPVYDSSTGKYKVDPGNENVKTITAFKLNQSGNPIGMYLWTSDYKISSYQITPCPELENLLNYKGFSIRIQDYSGIRYKADIAVETKEALASTSGYNGFKLKEYGVLAMPAAYLSSYPLVVDGKQVKGAVDYYLDSNGEPKEKRFARENGFDSFTGLLVDIPKSAYSTEIAFRSYITLEKDGRLYTFYQMPLQRSIYYLANQYISKNMYEEGSFEYQYLMDIINSVSN